LPAAGFSGKQWPFAIAGGVSGGVNSSGNSSAACGWAVGRLGGYL
jgi:hypothetical protein